MMDIRFDCTQCGKCCHDLRIPLSIEEARIWAGRGHQVDVLTEASPASGHVDADDPRTRYRIERSFSARSGSLPISVHVILVARHVGPCPHLRPDMRCGNYELRPRICRIYPAEVVPGTELSPATKKCPEEAWSSQRPIFLRRETLVSHETRRLIDEHRAITLADVAAKAAACARLGISEVALANEGLASCSPPPPVLVAALDGALAGDGDGDGDVARPSWTFVSNRSGTAQLIEEAGGAVQPRPAGIDYLGFFADALT